MRDVVATGSEGRSPNLATVAIVILMVIGVLSLAYTSTMARERRRLDKGGGVLAHFLDLQLISKELLEGACGASCRCGGRDNQHREFRGSWSLSGKEVERSLALRHRSPDVVRPKHSSDRVAGVEVRVVIADGGRCFPQCTAELVPLGRGQHRE